MNINIFRKRTTEQAGDMKSDDGESKLFGGKAKSVLGANRRALGDITNSVAGNLAGDQDKSGAKKIMSWFQGSSLAPTVIQPPPPPIISADDAREYMQREADDIDSRDASNPLLCSEYVNEMYEIFRVWEREFQVNANYMANQPYINERMRTILIDWLVIWLYFNIVLKMKINIYSS